jgi:hypothetical protein
MFLTELTVVCLRHSSIRSDKLLRGQLEKSFQVLERTYRSVSVTFQHQV